MRKLFKKSLACILTAIICVSLCVVAVPASAATPTYSTNAVVAKAGETVSIDFTVSNFTDVQGAIIKFSLPSVVASVSEVKINGEALAPFDASTGNGYYEVNGTTIKFLSLFGLEGELDARDALTFNIKAVVSDTAEVGTYTYPAPEFQVAQGGAIVDVTGSFGKFEIIPTVVEPVLDNKLAIMLRSASVQDTLGIGYVISNATFAAYDHIELEIVAEKYDANRDLMVAEAVTIPVAKLNASLSNATYTGIAMFELDLNVTAKIKAYDANGNYVAYSKSYTDTPVALLKSTYSTSKSPEFKTMVTDMLNLGTEAQKYFGETAAQKNPDNDLLAAYNNNPINKGWDQSDASASLPELTLLNSITWAEGTPLTSSDLTFMPSLNYAATPTLGYLIIDKKNKFTSADLRLDVSYTTVYPTAFAGLKTQSFTGAGFTSVGTYETAAFSKMTLTDSNQTITAKLYYKDQLVLTSLYTIEQGINSSPAGSKPLGEALGKFEAAARAYFATLA